MRRTRVLHLTLLASVGTLSSCSSPDHSEYSRYAYPNSAACMTRYGYIRELEHPCIQEGQNWYGPYGYQSGPSWVYLGYGRGGTVLTRGVTYSPSSHSSQVFTDLNAPSRVSSSAGRTSGGFGTVSRGGFGTSARGGDSGGG